MSDPPGVRSLPIALLLLTACGSTQVAPSPQPSSTSASSSASASASESPSPSSSVAVTLAPGAVGKRVFALPVVGGEKPNSVVVSMDLPESWGIETSMLGPSFESCASSQQILGTSVSLVARACAAGEDGPTCVKRHMLERQKEAPVVDEVATASRRWVAWEVKSKSGEPIHAAWLFVHDPVAGVVVTCGYALSLESEQVRAAYKDVCATVAIQQTSEKPAAEPNRPPRPDGALGNASEVPNGAALSAAALGFFDAMSKRDMKAAEAFLVGPEDCAALAPANAPESVLTKCRAEMALTEFESHFDEIADTTPKFEPAGGVVLTLASGGSAKNKNTPLYFAYVLDKAKPCEPSESGFPVAMIGDKAKVLMLRKKEK